MAQAVVTIKDGAVFGYLNPQDTKYEHKHPMSCVKYVVSGHLTVDAGGVKTHVRKGEYVFIRKNCAVSLIKQAQGAEPYGAITLNLERSFLKAYFSQMDRSAFPDKPHRMHEPVLKLQQSEDIARVFEPLTKYLDPAEKPSSEVIRNSMEAAVACLLKADDRLFPTLFDFNEPWKIDIMAFMEKHFMRHLSLAEFANYTGRSLATFKRDFSKISDVTPQTWLRTRRLGAAYEMLQSGTASPSDVYLRVGFENRTHFIAAFKQQYGVTPSSI